MPAATHHDPQDGPCPHCKVLKEYRDNGLCAACGKAKAVNKAISPHHSHLQRPLPTAVAGAQAVWDPIHQDLCEACYKADYRTAYGKEP